jgi:plastocyanin
MGTIRFWCLKQNKHFVKIGSQLIFLLFFQANLLIAQNPSVHTTNVAEGWANNSVNTVIFRKNSLVSLRDTQFIAFYDAESRLVLGKRALNSSQWQLKKTAFKGNTNDAHNDISIMLDGKGYLHIAFDHHNHPLRYCRSIAPFSLDLTDKMPMTGTSEQRVSYPEFYSLPNGNLLFFYRDGQSGQGNLILNQYDAKSQKWVQLHNNLIDGEGKRNAYWQANVDAKGGVHVSWVWRESPDVASNHDLAYARSMDGGKTWEKSTGEKYSLPITAQTAEYAGKIPQKSELINQTSMFVDKKGHPFIATYWREAGDSTPQYHIVYKTNRQWQTQNLGFRKTPFSLSGMGTKRIPISRPQIVVNKSKPIIVFRDAERGDKVSIAICQNLKKKKWRIFDLNDEPVGSWEPTFDTELWKNKGILHLFIQKTEQIDGEGKANNPPQMVKVLECSFSSM